MSKLILLFSVLLSAFEVACSPSGPLGLSWDSGTSSAGSSPQNSLSNGFQGKALAILQTNCTSCHTANAGPGGVYAVTDVAHLLADKLVQPGAPETSPLYLAMASGGMPPNGPLSSDDLATIEEWISTGNSASSGTTTTLPGPTSTTTLPPVLLGATYASLAANVFGPRCIECHNATKADGGYHFETYPGVLAALDLIHPEKSPIYTETHGGSMPPKPNALLSSAEEQTILAWITAGAPEVGEGGPTTTTLPSSTTTTLPAPLSATFQNIEKTILKPSCIGCHSTASPAGKLAFDTYAGTLKALSLVNPTTSRIYTETKSGSMPPGNRPKLSAGQVAMILAWIKAKAPNN